MTTARVALLRQPDAAFVLEELELPELAEGEVLVEIAGAGFCHTDLLPTSPAFRAARPLVVGHEGSGTVVESRAAGLAVGTPVVLTFDSCANCKRCRGGQPTYCDQFFSLNLGGRGRRSAPAVDSRGVEVNIGWFGQSSFATHAIAGPTNVVPVTAKVPVELLGPLGCGIQTGAGAILHALSVQAGMTVAVYGAGAVGLAAVMAARLAGASAIIAVDLHDSRLETALRLGATHVVRGDALDVTRQVRAISRGGVERALDTTAASAVIAAAVDALSATGVLGLVGAGTAPIELRADALVAGKAVRGILEGDVVPSLFIPTLIDLWQQGRFPFDELTRCYPLDDINQAAADAASGLVIKPILRPKD